MMSIPWLKRVDTPYLLFILLFVDRIVRVIVRVDVDTLGGLGFKSPCDRTHSVARVLKDSQR